jgi:hypothetical protein
MTRKSLLFEASAPVAAPVAIVRKLIDDGWVADAFLGSDAARAYVDVDHRPGVAGFQGHWWYRGEISAAAAGDRTMLTYRVYNVAPQPRWVVALANRLFIGYRRKVRAGVTGLARRIEQGL